MLLLADARNGTIDIEAEPLDVARAIWERGLRSEQEYKALKKALPFQHQAVQTAMYLRKHNLLDVGCDADFDKINPCDSCAQDYQEIIENMHLVMKVFRTPEIWKGFLDQISNYQFRAPLRFGLKSGAAKFVHNSGKIVDYKAKTPEEKQSKVHQHTKKQSATRISSKLHTPYFGHQHQQKEASIGLFFDERLCVTKARLRYDRGTVSRQWVGNKADVEAYTQYVQDKKNKISFTTDEDEEFNHYINQERGNINELLIKLSKESILGISIISSSNITKEDKANARQYQAYLKQRTGIDYPIFIYIFSQRSMRLYTKREQLDDEHGVPQEIIQQKMGATSAVKQRSLNKAVPREELFKHDANNGDYALSIVKDLFGLTLSPEKEAIRPLLDRLDALESQFANRFSFSLPLTRRVDTLFVRSLIEPLKKGLLDEQASLDNLVDFAEQFLKMHWQKTKFPIEHYATPETHEEVIYLLHDIATWVAQEKNKNRPADSPKITSLSLIIPIGNLPENIRSVKKLMANYVFDSSKEQFVPLKLLERLTLTREDFLAPHLVCELEEQSFTALREHSTRTQELVNAYENYYKLIQDKDLSLYDALNRLSDDLVISDTEGKTLEEAIARIDAFATLWPFYGTRGIPSSLVALIENVFEARKKCTSGENKADIETIADLQKSMISLVSTNQNLLREIHITPNIVPLKLKKEFDRCKSQLFTPAKKRWFLSDKPRDAHKLQINGAILKHYNYDQLLRMKPIKSLDAFQEFIAGVPLSLRAGFFAAMKPWWPKIIFSSSYKTMYLDVFQKLLLQTTDSEESQSAFFDAIHHLWSKHIKTVDDFLKIKACVTDKELAQIMDAIEPDLHQIITNIKEYHTFKAYLLPEQNTKLLALLRVKNPDLWRHIYHQSFIDTVKKQVVGEQLSQLTHVFRTYVEKQRTEDEEASLKKFFALNKNNVRLEELISQDLDFFTTHMKPRLAEIYENYLDSSFPGQLMNQFFADNPWVHFYGEEAKDKLIENELVSAFIRHAFTHAMQNIQYTTKLHLPISMTKHLYSECKNRTSNLDPERFAWPKRDKAWLEQQSHHFIFTHLHDYASYPLSQYASVQGTQWKSHALSRMDMLRYIANNEVLSPSGVAAIRPLLVMEFEATKEKDGLKKALINLGTEEAPVWVFLLKQEDDWHVYMPSGLDASFTSKLLPSYHVHEIQEAHHRALSDVSDEDPVVAWHALLLGRVLPWHFNAPQIDLSQYRQTLPLPLLEELVTLQCVPAQEKVAIKTAAKAFQAQPLGALFDSKHLISSTLGDEGRAARVIDLFDKQIFVINEQDMTAFSINSLSATLQHVLDASYILYRTPIKKLILPPEMESDNKNEAFHLFDYNLTLREVLPLYEAPNSPLFAHALATAARNCFLDIQNEQVLKSAETSLGARKALWHSAGQSIIYLLQTQSPEKEAAWPYLKGMGIKGLDVLFQALHTECVTPWDAVYLKPAPGLNCVLDLHDSRSIPHQGQYISALARHISSFDAQRKGCAPLFKQLSVNLIQPLTQDCLPALTALVLALKTRKALHDVEPDELILSNLRLDDPQVAYLFQELQQRADNANDPLDIVIRIPEWDNAPQKDHALWYHYKTLQNKTLDNQRQKRVPLLQRNTSPMDKLTAKEIAPAFSIRSKPECQQIPVQSTPRVFLLKSQLDNLSLAQEQQQEQEQEQEQEQSQQQEVQQQSLTPPPVDAKLPQYTDKEDDLITRADDPELFSRMVGSHIDAPHVISYITRSAWTKLVAYKTSLGLGFNIESYTAGFSLRQINDQIVLCFNPDEERCNFITGFDLHLTKPMPASLIRGDFRQLHLLTSQISEQNKLWDIVTNKDTSEDDFLQALLILRTWAKNVGAQEAVLFVFFDDINTIPQLRKTAAAFGQLFNQYDANGAPLKGTERLILLANQIHSHLGVEALKIWKKRVFDATDNPTELLEQKEIEALSLSLVTLSPSIPENRIFWHLIDAHGQDTGHVSYEPLWRSYSTVLYYFETNRLGLYEKSMQSYLEKSTGAFNAIVFLDRLNTVLSRTEKAYPGHKIADAILKNVDQIDWRHNGYFYASVYSGYPYWDESLKLHDFYSTTSNTLPPYDASWDNDIEIHDPITHTLRFACQRTGLDYNDFLELKEKISAVQHPNALILRILSACLSIGQDVPADLKNVDAEINSLSTKDAEVLQWINQALILSGVLHKETLHMPWAQLSRFITLVAANEDVKHALLHLKGKEALLALNAYGRALQCHAIDDQHILNLLAFGMQHGFSHPYVTDYPWLNEEAAQSIVEHVTSEREVLKQQLHSIDHVQSSYLPSQQELSEAIRETSSEQQAFNLRRSTIKQWIKQGLAITYQDYAFRPLTHTEYKDAKNYLIPRLKAAHQNENQDLCLRFLEQHLAIEQDKKQQTKELLNVLISLDNKLHYNELGQILGLLIQYASIKPVKRYSAPQLSAWLKGMVNEAQYKHRHFPIGQLKELLNSSQAATLLNEDFGSLESIQDEKRLSLVTKIAQLNLKSSTKQVLMNITFQPQLEEHFLATVTAAFTQMKDIAEDAPHLIKAMEQLALFLQDNSRCNEAKRIFAIACEPLPFKDKKMQALGHSCHTFLFNAVLDGNLSIEQLLHYFSNDNKNEKSAYINIILTKTVQFPLDEQLLKSLMDKLHTWDVSQLNELASYVSDSPRPSMAILNQLLHDPIPMIQAWIISAAPKPVAKFKKIQEEPLITPTLPPYNNRKAADLIHLFESVVQGRSINPNDLYSAIPKRSYGLSEGETESLMRVLQGVKRKTEGLLSTDEQTDLLSLLHFMNHVSIISGLSEKPLVTLQQDIKDAVADIKKTIGYPNHMAKATLLALMREVLLRKTGNWANNTQMLALLYGTIHEDDGLIYQLRTGEGKSIITLLDTGFNALQGKMVSVFSSKPSLSKRDAEEAAPVLEAMGLRTSYVTENSSIKDYHNSLDSKGFGAVNYAAPRNFILFCFNQAWNGHPVDLSPKDHVAFIDEADYILDQETTQCNFSRATEDNGNALYNSDEWVYRAVHDFYEANVARFKTDAKGQMIVSNQKELPALCEFIQDRAAAAPPSSGFLSRFIMPALQGDEEAIEQRDEELLKLLVATDTAHRLHQDIQYCVRPEWNQSLYTDTRFANPLNNNQMAEGSTFSDRVQQFLHVLNNRKVAREGERPDFFVPPVSQVVLSSNVAHFLKHHFSTVRGCTGTAGDKKSLAKYKGFGIQQIMKVPTHEEKRVTYLASVYADNEAAQIDAIIDAMQHYQDRPILLMCEDDKAVKEYCDKVSARLKARNLSISIIQDTNDSGKTESSILEHVSRNGAVTFSSRMSRGTNPKPQTREPGLMTIGLYPCHPSENKQRHGRTGRNGAPGTCLDIFNMAAIKKEYDKYSQSHQELLEPIHQEQAEHLDKKLAKYKKAGHKAPKRWREDTLEGHREHRDNYLITRSLVFLKHQLKEEKAMYVNQKNALLAMMTSDILRVTQQWLQDSPADSHNPHQLAMEFGEFIKTFEALWTSRATESGLDTMESYEQFFQQADHAWKNFSKNYPALDAQLLEKILAEQKVALQAEVHQAIEQSHDANNLKTLNAFYQEWFHGALAAYTVSERLASASVIQTIYKGQKLNAYLEFTQTMNALLKDKRRVEEKEQLITCLRNMVDHKGAFAVYLDSINQVVNQLTRHIDEADFADRLSCFEHFFSLPWLQEKTPVNQQPEDIDKNSRLLTLVMSIVDEHQSNETEKTYEKILEDLLASMTAQIASSCEALAESTGISKDDLNLYLFHKVSQFLSDDRHAHHSASLATALTYIRDKHLNGNDKEPKLALTKGQQQLITGQVTHLATQTLSSFENINKARGYNPLDPESKPFYALLKDFITNMSTVCKDKFWARMADDAFNQKIAGFFKYNQNATKSLILHSSPDQLEKYLHLIEQSSTPALDKSLCHYLGEQYHALQQYPGLIYPIMVLGLTGGQTAPIAENLPDLLCLRNKYNQDSFDKTMYDNFWAFIINRPPIIKKDIDTLLAFLNGKHTTDELAQIINSLSDIPPHIPLSYINAHVAPTAKGTNDFKLKIEELSHIKEAGKTLFNFLAKRKCISTASANLYIMPTDKIMYERLVAVFTELNPQQNKEFFEFFYTQLDKFPNLSEQHLLDLAKRYLAKGSFKDYWEKQSLLLLLEPKTNHITPQRVTMLEQAIETIPHERLKIFIETIKEFNSELQLSDKQFKVLFEKWKDNTINSKERLDAALEAVQLSQNHALDTYFNHRSWDQKEIALGRQKIMRHLESGTLVLDNSDHYYDKLSRLYMDVIHKKSEEYHGKQDVFFNKKQHHMIRDHANIAKIVSDLSTITTERKDIGKRLESKEVQANNELFQKQHAQYKSLFTVGLRNYSEMFFRCFAYVPVAVAWLVTLSIWRPKGPEIISTHERSMQANKLFNTLQTINNDNVKNYYTSVLDTLAASQKEILKCTHGESRLYRITAEVFNEITHKILSHNALTPAEKRQLLLSNVTRQCQDNITLLKTMSNLPSGLREIAQLNITDVDKDHAILSEINDLIKEHGSKIPANLNYLLIPFNLACKIALAPAVYIHDQAAP